MAGDRGRSRRNDDDDYEDDDRPRSRRADRDDDDRAADRRSRSRNRDDDDDTVSPRRSRANDDDGRPSHSRSRSRDDADDEIAPPRRSRIRDDDDDDDRRPSTRDRGRTRVYDDDDDDDRGRRAKKGNGAATASMVLGLLTLVIPILGIVAVIVGFVGLSKAKASGVGKGMSLAGIAAGALLMLAWIGIGLAIYFLVVVPAQTVVNDNLNSRRIALGVHSHHDRNFAIPGPGGPPRFPQPGQPPSPLAWRVQLLPFIEQDPLHKRFKLNEPWDSSGNRPLSTIRVPLYVSDADPKDFTETRYRGFVGPGTVFDPMIPRGVSMNHITDGTSNTLLFVETADTVPWSKPAEIPWEGPRPTIPPLGQPKRGGRYMAAMCDGSVRWMNPGVDETVLRALITRQGGEVVNLPR